MSGSRGTHQKFHRSSGWIRSEGVKPRLLQKANLQDVTDAEEL